MSPSLAANLTPLFGSVTATNATLATQISSGSFATTGGFAGVSLRGLGADIVPVIVQDPTWERSFPDVPWVVLPTGTPAVPEYYKSAEYWPKDSLDRRAVLFAKIPPKA